MKHDSLINIIRERFDAAIATVAQSAPGEIDPIIRVAGDPKFGDYQCNVAMSLAKRLKVKPRDVAQRIVDTVELADVAECPEIAGPGFINIRFKNEFLIGYLSEIPAPGDEPDRLGMPPVDRPRKVVIDYSSVNIAKQMHVGHLRSTIIGDTFARVLMFEGHAVVRQNHVGDWGTQFGILIAYYTDRPIPTPETHADVLDAIEDGYRAGQELFKNDAEFAAVARAAVGKLQGGDPEARRIWEQLCATSRGEFLSIYHRLNVLLDDGDVCGESFYNDRLAPLVEELSGKLTVRDKSQPAEGPYAEMREDGGAQCIFLYDEKHQPLFTKQDGSELPMIVQKSDGAFLYATTDMAAIRYRIDDLGGDRLIYVTDARQKLHFEVLFAAARAVGWAGENTTLEHATFGSVMGTNRKPLKTRDGKNIKLRELLDEAEQRAADLLKQRNEQRGGDDDEAAGSVFTEQEIGEITRRVGIASVKYADLRNDRVSDYVFNWDKMLAMQGNTAPYMMYAYARIRSIYRKAAERFGEPDVYAAGVAIGLDDANERALALRLARLRETVDQVASELEPHVLCTYLYDLATDFMRFYESCPVLQAADEAARLSRMRLCDLTARALKLSLDLLGIETVERM